MRSLLSVLILATVGLNPTDPDAASTGLELRLEHETDQAPFLAGEGLERYHVRVSLTNVSRSDREYYPLDVAQWNRDLRITIRDPKGKQLERAWCCSRAAAKPKEFRKLRPGERVEYRIPLNQFDQVMVWGNPLGRYTATATLTLGKTTLTAPPLPFTYVAPRDADIVQNILLPLEGDEAAKKPEQQWVMRVQQITVQGRVLVVLRHYAALENRGVSAGIYRVTELPHAVDLKVEGAYGASEPLTLTYADATAPNGVRKLVVCSHTGQPWTEENERSLRETQRARRQHELARPASEAGFE
jgi:hypothetical protein